MVFLIYNFTQELFRVLYLLLIKDTCLSKPYGKAELQIQAKITLNISASF